MFEKKKLAMIFAFLLVSGLISACLQLRGSLPEKAGLPRSMPMKIGGWQGSPFSIVMPKEAEPEDYILRTYDRDDGLRLDMLAFFSRISDYHRPSICYRAAGHQLTDIPFLGSASGRIRLAGLMGRRDGKTILVYHGFFINGRIVPDGLEKKLYEMKEKLTRGYIDQYFFEVLVEVAGNDQARAVSSIKSFLNDMEPFLIHPQRSSAGNMARLFYCYPPQKA